MNRDDLFYGLSMDGMLESLSSEYKLPIGMHRLLRLIVLLELADPRDGFTKLELSNEQTDTLKADKQWLKAAIINVLDNGIEPIKALELQRGKGRKAERKTLQSNLEIVAEVEAMRNDENISQEDAINKVAGGNTELENSIRGRYMRALPEYRKQQNREKKLKDLLSLNTKMADDLARARKK